MSYAEVIVDNRAIETDRPFTYYIDESLRGVVKKGMRVLIPFGRGNRNIKGLVVNIKDDYDGNFKVKPIIDVLDDKSLVSNDLLELSFWMKERYLSSHIDALNLVLPPGDFKKIETYISIKEEKTSELDEDEEQIINFLNKKGRILLSDLKKSLNIVNINKTLNILEEKDLISIEIDIKSTIRKKTELWVRVLNPVKPLDEKLRKIGKAAHKQREIMSYINGLDEIPMKTLMEKLNTSNSPVKALEDKGLIEIFEKTVQREAVQRKIDKYEKHVLNRKQQEIMLEILDKTRETSGYGKFLLHGVTGSGKTEIYLQMVELMLEIGRDSIVLVPEISLTPQTVERFVGRFGDKVAVLHSRLSAGERFDEWRKIKEGRVKIVVGARSAIFAPFKDIGLIIIDEEHEASYKSSQNPKYITREVAEKRIEMANGMLILGSATPSIETYYLAKKKDYILLEMKERVAKKALPKVEIVDMRTELSEGNKSIFSKSLYKNIKETLEDKKQIILFLNRRGFSTFISCRECGYVVRCESCDISMTYHRKLHLLKCHYCGDTKRAPVTCPECSSPYIKYFGIGTERIEGITRNFFPDARIARMDADTMSKKGAYEKVLGDMKRGKIDILIGTQMISKGLDFKNVNLVGIITADTTLNLPDFKSAERTFQLVTQVAGRSGRGEDAGKVILQTYEPDHYSIKCAKTHDFNSFYDIEIGMRESYLYPPFVDMISILVYGEAKEEVIRSIKKIYNLIKTRAEWLKDREGYRFIEGPYPAPLEKIKNNFRWQIVLKVPKEYMSVTIDLIDSVCIENRDSLGMDNLKLSIDINPESIL